MVVILNILRIIKTVMLDTVWYQAFYEDVRNSNMEPRKHYFYYGFYEDRYFKKTSGLKKYIDIKYIISEIPDTIPERN